VGPLTHEVALSLLDSPFVVETDEERWIEFLRRLWEPFLAELPPPAAERAERVVLGREGARWRCVFPDEEAFVTADPWLVADGLRHRLVERAFARARGIVQLHAAGVSRDGAALLVAGPSGAGKTTLCVALLARGWRLLGDDTVPLDVGTGLALPFPKPLRIKRADQWPRYRHLWRDVPWLPEPQEVFFLRPGAFPLADRAGTRPGFLVFLAFSAGGPTTLEELNPAQAAALAGQFTGPLDGEGFRAVVRMAARARAASLAHGGGGEPLDRLESWLFSQQMAKSASRAGEEG